MADAVIRVPSPVNEPVRAYAPGSAEKRSLKARLAELSATPTEVAMHVGGERRGGGDRGALHAPHRHDLKIADHPVGGDRDVADAIAAALAARRDWAATPFPDRAAVFLRAAALLAGPWRDTINAATMLGQSKTVHQAEIDAACELIDFWRFNVHYAESIHAQQPGSDGAAWNRLEYRPLEGFVFAVTPFNFTSIAGNLPTAAAIMGNTIVWKPATQTLLVCHLIMELLREAGLPPGVVNLVTGSAQRIGEQALGHRELAGVHFTGSTEVFQWMWRQVAGHIGDYRTYPRLVGETGGKDFVLAHESADVDALRTALVRGAFEYQGQKCSAASRAYVPASMWRVMRDGLVAEVEELRQGDVADFRNFVGAVIDEAAFKRHSEAIARARADTTARVVAGGETDASTGWFVRPTVIETTDPRYWTMETELFGPILTVYPYPDGKFEEALELVDTTSPYALTGAIFARDRDAVRRADAALVNAAGNFYVNDKP
ncbi:MAG TPA: L-glutamate gamma-semialdehyde dehydrogenase, partial [Candidatus Dormibacteraeota bacterium]|nr:L-glutamate gamma-semialdehyde dehydrogenase [Candidatus Dormibacteraeota bacterium]